MLCNNGFSQCPFKTKGANAETQTSRHHNKTDLTMAKKPMVQLPRPSTITGNPGGPAGNNPPKP